MTTSDDGYIAALDVGGTRIGVALAHTRASLVSPHSTLTNDANLWQNLAELTEKEQIKSFVVGLPRGMSGQDTNQTKISREFAVELRKRLGLPVYLQDEAGTSVQAETELKERGKDYNKGMVDAWAAAIILEDYLSSRGRNNG